MTVEYLALRHGPHEAALNVLSTGGTVLANAAMHGHGITLQQGDEGTTSE